MVPELSLSLSLSLSTFDFPTVQMWRGKRLLLVIIGRALCTLRANQTSESPNEPLADHARGIRPQQPKKQDLGHVSKVCMFRVSHGKHVGDGDTENSYAHT